MASYYIQIIPDSGFSGSRSGIKFIEIVVLYDHLRKVFSRYFSPDHWHDVMLFNQVENNYDSYAALCLRCYISWCIRGSCIGLTTKYGNARNFTVKDIYHFALEDYINIQEKTSLQILAIEILSSWNPRQAKLSTWTNKLTWTYKPIVDFLEEHGVSKFSGWGLMNSLKSEELKLILRSINLQEAKIQQYTDLLTVFKSIYTEDRRSNSQGRGRKCQPPTPDQLRRMDEKYQQYSSYDNGGSILSELEAIIVHLRQYEKILNNNFISPERLEKELDDRVLENLQTNNDSEYRELLQCSIFKVVAVMIDKRYEKKQRRINSNSEIYLQALNLHFCQNMTQENIAIELNCGKQSTISRLLDLDSLYLDISISVLNELNDKGLIPATDPASSINQLDQIQRDITRYLNEEVILNDSVRTILSHAVCQYFQPRETL